MYVVWRCSLKIGVRINAANVTGPCTAVQYGLIMLTCSSRKLDLQHDRKQIGWNTELRTVRFGYWKTEPSDGFPQTRVIKFLQLKRI